MTLGEKLSKLRKEQNYTQEQLAEILGVSRQSISKWESDIAYPETDKLIELGKIFDCSMDYLLKDDITDKTGAPAPAVAEKRDTRLVQEITGIVMLAVSLIGGLILVLSGRPSDSLYLALILLAPIFACAMICLLVKRHALYWCAWAATAPIAVLSPMTVGITPVVAGVIVQTVVIIVRCICANRVYRDVKIERSMAKHIAIIAAWIAHYGMHFFDFRIRNLSPALYIVSSTLLWGAVALLATYTICYGRKDKK